MRKKFQKQEGMIEVEAILVIYIWINIIFFLFNMGIVMYQQMNVVVSANEAAANVAETFNMLQSDPFTVRIEKNDFIKRNPYRYWDETKYENWTEIKADWYGAFRVAGNEFTHKDISPTDGVKSTYKQKQGYRILEVEITREYDIFALNPVEAFGLNPKHSVTAIGSAVCYDPIHDMNVVALGKEVEDGLYGLSTTGSIVENAIKLIGKIDEILRTN